MQSANQMSTRPSVIAAVNHTDKSDLPPEFPQDTSFSGALTSVPNFPYRIYFFEHTATGEKLASFEIIKDSLDRIREYGPTIDVVNLSLGLQCDPTDGPIVYNNCVYNPARACGHSEVPAPTEGSRIRPSWPKPRVVECCRRGICRLAYRPALSQFSWYSWSR